MPRLLIIDDTPVVREPLARLLRHEGFETIAVANGLEALGAMCNQTPDLILLDMMMPKMNGVGFLEAIRRDEHWQHVPVILLTGTFDSTQLSRARELNVRQIVSKADFDFDALIATIRKNLN